MSPYTAYQITSMMEGVVERGTGKKVKVVGKPVAGKTGTSNDERDAWFIGYTPDLVVGTYVGYDNPKPMGKGRTGGELAAPIVADFMQLALRDKPATPFRVPRAIELMPIDAKTGKRAIFGQRGRHPRGLQAGRRAAGFHQDHRRADGHRRRPEPPMAAWCWCRPRRTAQPRQPARQPPPMAG